jgi:predicted DNA-binding ribbon-helix-helix protein
MGSRKSAVKASRRGAPRTVRASVTLNGEVYRTLETLAKQKKVSTAWVLRDAAEKYVADQWPLFGKPDHEG